MRYARQVHVRGTSSPGCVRVQIRLPRILESSWRSVPTSLYLKTHTSQLLRQYQTLCNGGGAEHWHFCISTDWLYRLLCEALTNHKSLRLVFLAATASCPILRLAFYSGVSIIWIGRCHVYMQYDIMCDSPIESGMSPHSCRSHGSFASIITLRLI